METAEDILAVYRELQNIQSQIEQYEGRRQFLDRMVDMSTSTSPSWPWSRPHRSSPGPGTQGPR